MSSVLFRIWEEHRKTVGLIGLVWQHADLCLKKDNLSILDVMPPSYLEFDSGKNENKQWKGRTE